MGYKKFIIECGNPYSRDLRGIFLNENMTNNTAFLGYNTICVDTKYNLKEIKTIITICGYNEGYVTQLTSVENQIEPFYSENIVQQIKDFIIVSDISDDLDYFLDRIIMVGGVKNLTEKELQRLKELS